MDVELKLHLKEHFGGVRTLHQVAIVDPEPNVCVGVFAIPNVGQAPSKINVLAGATASIQV